jgi:hypothetical protein
MPLGRRGCGGRVKTTFTNPAACNEIASIYLGEGAKVYRGAREAYVYRRGGRASGGVGGWVGVQVLVGSRGQASRVRIRVTGRKGFGFWV